MEQVEELLDRPKLYSNIDGTGELGYGVLFFGYGLLLLLMMHLPEKSFWHVNSALFYICLLVIVGFGTIAIKKYITYPRTGFVKYRVEGFQDTAISTIFVSLIPMGLDLATRRDLLFAIFWAFSWPICAGFTALRKKDSTIRTLLGEYGEEDCRRTTILSIAISALIPWGMVFAALHNWNVAIWVAFIGPIFAVAYARRFARTVRWKGIVASVIALASMAIAFIPRDIFGALVGESPASQSVRTRVGGTILIASLTYGLILLISGSISFLHYLLHTASPAKEDQ
jgi:hypothetical protein